MQALKNQYQYPQKRSRFIKFFMQTPYTLNLLIVFVLSCFVLSYALKGRIVKKPQHILTPLPAGMIISQPDSVTS